MSTGDSWKLFEHGFSTLFGLHGKNEFDPGADTWPDNSLRWSKESTEGCHIQQGSISAGPSGLKLRKSSLFSRTVSCENDVSLEILVTTLMTTLASMRRPNLGNSRAKTENLGNFLIT